MQAIDTNLLVRLFVNDDAGQGRKVRDLFDSYADVDAALWIADIVLVELVWTLSRAYGRDKLEIVRALRALCGNATVLLESGSAIARAVDLYEAGPADFADSLLVCKARQLGCEAVRTFDKKMRSLPGVKLL